MLQSPSTSSSCPRATSTRRARCTATASCAWRPRRTRSCPMRDPRVQSTAGLPDRHPAVAGGRPARRRSPQINAGRRSRACSPRTSRTCRSSTTESTGWRRGASRVRCPECGAAFDTEVAHVGGSSATPWTGPYQEVAYLACRVHWTRAELLSLDHASGCVGCVRSPRWRKRRGERTRDARAPARPRGPAPRGAANRSRSRASAARRGWPPGWRSSRRPATSGSSGSSRSPPIRRRRARATPRRRMTGPAPNCPRAHARACAISWDRGSRACACMTGRRPTAWPPARAPTRSRWARTSRSAPAATAPRTSTASR